MFKPKKGFYLLSLLLMIGLILTACGSEENEVQEDETQVSDLNAEYATEVTENPLVTITMDMGDQIVIELEPKVAPNTVANFISLVQEGYYDGLIFHRVIPGFMIQGGDPTGTGSGGPGYSIDGEFSENNFENNLTHDRGVISMARSQDPDSAGSQFFIMTEQSPHLDGQYASFGKVIEGIEVVDQIVAVERNQSNNKPTINQQMKTVTVDTKGFAYPKPAVNK